MVYRTGEHDTECKYKFNCLHVECTVVMLCYEQLGKKNTTGRNGIQHTNERGFRLLMAFVVVT